MKIVSLIAIVFLLIACKKSDAVIDKSSLPTVTLRHSYGGFEYNYISIYDLNKRPSNTFELYADIIDCGYSNITSRGFELALDSNFTQDYRKFFCGAGKGRYTYYVSRDSLINKTIYYYRAFAENSYGKTFSTHTAFNNLDPNNYYKKGADLKDIDGNVYKTIEFKNGDTWMAENLKVTRLNTGELISELSSTNTTKFWTYYENDSSYNQKYGKLYSSNIQMTKQLCPTSWHIPTDNEWYNLNNVSYAEIYPINVDLKSTSDWKNNANGIDLFEFNAKPSGYYEDGNFYRLGYYAVWWSQNGSNYKIRYDVEYIMESNETTQNNAFAVRCVKDK